MFEHLNVYPGARHALVLNETLEVHFHKKALSAVCVYLYVSHSGPLTVKSSEFSGG